MMPGYSTFWICWRAFSVIAVGVLWLLVLSNIEQLDNHDRDANLSPKFVIDTEGCRIPDYSLFSPSTPDHIFDEKDVQCDKSYGMALVESNTTALYINKAALSYYNINHVSDLRCCYTPFWRVELKESLTGKYPRDVDSRIRFKKTCNQFTDQVEVTEEFVKVQCLIVSSKGNTSVYTDYHAFTPNKSISKRREHVLMSEKSLNVIIVGVPSVSRLNLHRQMPITLDFLKYNLSAVEFFGYNKVGGNTYTNMIPVLTGTFKEELINSCFSGEYGVFDNCTFIWDRFHKAGYVTAFSEDLHLDSGIFSSHARGFRKQPTDYYTKPFHSQAEEDIGSKNRPDTDFCIGPRKSLKVLLHYAFKFAYKMKNILSFVFVLGSDFSQFYLNLPNQVDTDHKDFLENLYRNKILNRTILVFMSDQGMRYSELQTNSSEYFEERLPFLFVAYPEWFETKFYSAVNNLKSNSYKLTTPFDLHETLLDLVNLTCLEKENLRVRSENLVQNHTLPRGISLFLPIPGTRTCKDAEISDHWCTCHQSVRISTNETVVENSANLGV